MQTMSQVFQAAGTWNINYLGRYFRLLDTSGGPVTIQFFRQNRAVSEAKDVLGGYWLKVDDEQFDRVDIITDAAGRVEIAMSNDSSGGYDRISGKVDSRLTPALSVLNKPMLLVGVAESVVIGQNINRASLRLFNASTANIWIGGAGLSLTDAAIKLAPGELWVEETAAGAAWVAIADAANAPLKIQEILY
ncbi:hypothetical protein [Janthinobacterium sp. B9-8]|uniref:hypothetical protein n=1 Tax=Janthinobacterium sp. B9-8 TaxID=1236179 RepID=UPI00061CF927|nr:hypothetical protein [Janthinobacterium sp. B9-8]AMC34233.1 hypothetical protein VN23_06300 [Janthinobacterium sp. B9-8]